MPKFIVGFVLFVCIVVMAFPSQASASQTQNYNNNTEKTFAEFLSLAKCVIYGGNSVSGPCFNSSQSGGSAGGLLTIGYSTADLFFSSPPLSTQQYIASVTKKFSPVQEASAQVSGSGSSVISSIFIFWQAARNVAYVLMTVIFLIIGLMILLGRKTGGQSVLTIQAALPGLVISLVMITFSYFLAALITDLAFYGCYLVAYIFRSILQVSLADPARILATNNIIQLFTSYIFNTDNFWNVINFVYSLSASDPTVRLGVLGAGGMIAYQLAGPLGGFVGSLIPGGNFGDAGRIIGGVFAGMQIATAPRTPEFLVGTLIYVILGVALILSLVRLLRDLVQRYLTILFLTIFGPLIFLFSALPGNNKGYESWIRNMLCNALAFPAVFAGFYFASYFLVGQTIFEMTNRAISQTTIGLPTINLPVGFFTIPVSGSITIPTINTTATLPLFGGYNLGIINQIIGFGILLVIPAIPDYVCKMLGAKLDDVFGKEIAGSLNTSRGRTMGYFRNFGGNINNAATKGGTVIGTRTRGTTAAPAPTSGRIP